MEQKSKSEILADKIEACVEEVNKNTSSLFNKGLSSIPLEVFYKICRKHELDPTMIAKISNAKTV